MFKKTVKLCFVVTNKKATSLRMCASSSCTSLPIGVRLGHMAQTKGTKEG